MSLIPKISWELEKHENSSTLQQRCCVPQKKKYDLLKEKKAAFGGKKGAVLTAAAAMAGKSKTEIAIFLTLFFTFFPRALIAPMNDRIEFRVCIT